MNVTVKKNANKGLKIFNLIFLNPKNYLYIFTIYHLLIIYTTFYLGHETTNHIWFSLTLDSSQIESLTNKDFLLQNGFWSVFIVFLDLILLTIISLEFKNLRLTYKKICILEVIIFYFSITNILVRDLMFFLSINTLQIFLIYSLIKKFKLLIPVFVFGGLYQLGLFIYYLIV